jgi:hypothetical protein
MLKKQKEMSRSFQIASAAAHAVLTADLVITKTIQAVRLAQIMLSGGFYAAIEGTVKAAFYLSSSSEERSVMRIEARREKAADAIDDAWFAGMQKERYDGIRDFILLHPAAGKLSDIPAQGQEDAIALLNRAFGELSRHLQHMLPRTRDPEIILGKEGGIEDGNSFLSKNYIPLFILASTLGPESGQEASDKAQALWNWIYTFAVSEEAPHLLSDLKLEVVKGGKLRVKFADPEALAMTSQVPLWRADMEAAQQKRAAAPKVSVLKK